MFMNRSRLAGVALLVGGVLAIAGYTAASAAAGWTGWTGDARFTNPLWIPLYSVALAGNLLVVLGLPVILSAHGGLAYRLTTVGFAGTLLAMVMLNIGEGTTEGYVKPYLVAHGGIPQQMPGFNGFILVGLVAILIGLTSLGIAVIRARVFPVWVGILFLVAVPLGIIQLPGQLGQLGDDAFFLALVVTGWSVAFGQTTTEKHREELRATEAVG